MDRVALLLFFVIILRFLFWAYIWSNIKKKTYRNCVDHCSQLDRWFFWTSHHLINSKYSKYEKRTINYKIGASIIFVLNFLNHMTLLAYSLLFLLTMLPKKTNFWVFWWENTRILPVVLFLVEIAIIACINYYEHRRFHRKRMKW